MDPRDKDLFFLEMNEKKLPSGAYVFDHIVGDVYPTPNQLCQLAVEGMAQGVKSAFSDLSKRYCAMKISTGAYNNIPDVAKMVDELNKYDEKFVKPFGYFITVNPKQDVDPSVLYAKVSKWCNKRWVKECIGGYEYRDEDAKTGLHVHMYVRYKGLCYADVKRETYSTFKDLVGNEKHVYIRRIKELDETKVVNYCVKQHDMFGVGEVFHDIYSPKPVLIFEE